MKLNYDFEFVDMGEEGFYGVPVGEHADRLHAMLKINGIARQMLTYMQESNSPEEVCEKLCRDYPDEDPEAVRGNLKEFLEQLVQEGIVTL